jgi:hypothetical protein
VTDDFNSNLGRFRREIVERGDFTHDWFTNRIESLEAVLRPLERQAARVLEIGSFEGLSTRYFLWRLADARVTCVDTFQGTAGLPSEGREGLEAAFDRNVALGVGSSRVRKLRGTPGASSSTSPTSRNGTSSSTSTAPTAASTSWWTRP